MGGKLYAIGGFDGSRDLSSIEAFDLQTGTWAAQYILAGAVLAATGVFYSTTITTRSAREILYEQRERRAAR